MLPRHVRSDQGLISDMVNPESPRDSTAGGDGLGAGDGTDGTDWRSRPKLPKRFFSWRRAPTEALRTTPLSGLSVAKASKLAATPLADAAQKRASRMARPGRGSTFGSAARPGGAGQLAAPRGAPQVTLGKRQQPGTDGMRGRVPKSAAAGRAGRAGGRSGRRTLISGAAWAIHHQVAFP